MLEENVTSLELSIKLSELGIIKKTMFYWEYLDDKCYGIKYFPYCVVPVEGNFIKLYSAFTASELMNIMPNTIDTKINEPFNCFRTNIQKFIVYLESKLHNAYSVKYICDTFDPRNNLLPLIYHSEWDINLSNSLAKMIIFLSENKYLNS